MMFKEYMGPSSMRIYRTKNELDATKLVSFEVNWLFLQKILDGTTHNLFSNISKNP